MTSLQKIWHELTRPRSLPGQKTLMKRSDRRSGIALLVAVTTLLVLSIVVSELAYISQVRFQVAYHQRDRAQAYWLARSGVNIYNLVLVGDQQIGRQIEQFAGDLGVASLWQMVPVINTGLMRMLFVNDAGGVDDLEEKDIEQFQSEGKVSDEVAEASREGGGSLFSDKNFLDFEGDFSAEVTDNESKIDVNILQNAGDEPIQALPAAQFLFNIMNSEEDIAWFQERNLDQWEIIGNLKDWVDADNIRSAGLGGYEDTLYNNLEPPYLAKNSPFDTIEEIRLVGGWQDEVFERYGQYLTIFSNGKNNPNNWDERQHAAAFIAADPNIATVEQALSLPCFADTIDASLTNPMFQSYRNRRGYVQTNNGNCGTQMEVANLTLEFTTKSQVFTVTSTGLVGNSSVKITAVLDFSSNKTGAIRYWRIE